MKWMVAKCRLALVLSELALAAGCARTLSATTRVPNPLVLGEWGGKSDVSYDVSILIKDLKQPEGLAHPSENQAGVNYTGSRAGVIPSYVPPRYFPQAAVIQYANANEIHFAVLLTSEWRELTRLGGYTVELSDDRGTIVAPDDSWMNAEGHKDYEGTYQAIKRVQTARIHESGSVSRTYTVWAPEEYYVDERVYRGRGTVVFRRPDVLRRDTKSLTLTLRSRARTLKFTWYFDERVRT